MARPRFLRQPDTILQKHIVEQSAGYTLDIGQYNVHECAVLFFDLCNFTNISWTLSTDEVLSILQPFFEAVGKYVSSQGGMIDKYPGDGVVAFIPRDYGDDKNTTADDALDCAAQVMGWFYRVLRPAVDLPKPSHVLDLAIGIDAGRIAVAHVGSAVHSELILLGGEVNCASKCQAAAEAREVVVGQDAIGRLYYSNLYGKYLSTGPNIGVVYTTDNRRYLTSRFDWAKCAEDNSWARP